MGQTEDEVRKTLDGLFESAKNSEDINEIQFAIDDYIEEGYNVKDYIHKYNSAFNKLKKD
jgi:hypothetical protein